METKNKIFGLSIKNEKEMKDWLQENQIKSDIKNLKDASSIR